jgi:hypothetical protein
VSAWSPQSSERSGKACASRLDLSCSAGPSARPLIMHVGFVLCQAVVASSSAAHVGRRLALLRTRPPMLALDQQSVAALEERRERLQSELDDVTSALERDAAEKRDGLPIALGSRTSAFEPSFGYLSRSAGVYTEALAADGSNLPSSALDLAVRNFRRELPELIATLNGTAQAACERDNCSPEAEDLRARLDALVLSNDAVWERERQREAAGGKVRAPPLLLLAPSHTLRDPTLHPPPPPPPPSTPPPPPTAGAHPHTRGRPPSPGERAAAAPRALLPPLLVPRRVLRGSAARALLVPRDGLTPCGTPPAHLPPHTPRGTPPHQVPRDGRTHALLRLRLAAPPLRVARMVG